MSAMNESVLFVDDEPNLLAAVQRQLRAKVNLRTADSAAGALDILAADGPFSVVVSDMRMPEMDGVEFLHRVRTTSPHTVRIMLTGNTDQDTAIRAVNESNIFRFLSKPCPAGSLLKAIGDAQEQYRLLTAEKQLLEQTLKGSVRLLTEILELVNPETFGRAGQIRDRVRRIASKLQLEDTWQVEIAAMLCHLGSVSLPPDLLRRAASRAPLNNDETQVLREIPSVSERLIRNIPRLESVAEAILYQAKNFDGTGYPDDDRSGERIPLGSRLLRIAIDIQSSVDAGKSEADAWSELFNHPGKYDLGIVQRSIGSADSSAGAAPGADTKALELSVTQLSAGHRLRASVHTKGGLLLAKEGTILTEAVIERIRNFERLSGVRQPLVVEAQRENGENS